MTIREIALLCGYSTATVSKALNGHTDIGEETARFIRSKASEFGYFPNAAARALKTNRTNNLGILFIDEQRSGLTHEFFSAVLESFKSQAEKCGYDITFLSNRLGSRTLSYLEHCQYRGLDGVGIACVDFRDERVVELVKSEIPCVTIDHVFDDCSVILSDNVQGMRDLTDYVLGMGHTRVAFIHAENTAVTRKRIAGFTQACRAHGVDVPQEYLVESMYHDPKGSALATRKLLALPNPPTCILYPDDISFLGGMTELERQGLKIPADISATGYDGIALSQLLRPRLTTLRQDSGELGAAAARRLIKAIEDPQTDFPDQTLIPGMLVPGQTVRSLL